MRLLLPLLACALLGAVEDLGALRWADGPPGPGVELAGAKAIVRHPDGGVVALGRFPLPALRRHQFALVGRLSHRGLGSPSYVEMMVVFPSGARLPVRTQDDAGPLAWLRGDGRRELALPFDWSVLGTAPVAVELAVAMPTGGRVELEPLRLLAFAPDESLDDRPGSWWPRRALVRGGLLVAAGMGLWGVLALALVRRRRSHGAGRVALLALAGAGIAAAVTGLVALVLGQPRPVWLPLAFAGTVAAATGLAAWYSARRSPSEV
ncbi:MAG: hypothetical protein L6R48_09730 [Planctomycetes bacterium]|nr:hypothetical protein [Planctomycetota bacterium]